MLYNFEKELPNLMFIRKEPDGKWVLYINHMWQWDIPGKNPHNIFVYNEPNKQYPLYFFDSTSYRHIYNRYHLFAKALEAQYLRGGKIIWANPYNK